MRITTHIARNSKHEINLFHEEDICITPNVVCPLMLLQPHTPPSYKAEQSFNALNYKENPPYNATSTCSKRANSGQLNVHHINSYSLQKKDTGPKMQQTLRHIKWMMQIRCGYVKSLEYAMSNTVCGSRSFRGRPEKI
jgi:hypothetical protein